MKWLVSFFLLLFTLTAAAQTIPLPQSVGPPAYVVGITPNGVLIPHVPTIGDIATPNPQSSSTTGLWLGGPQIQFLLDNPNGFTTGNILFIQVPQAQDNFAYCVATSIDSTGFVACNITFIQGGGYYDNFAVTVVNGYTTNSVPPWAGQGVDGTTAVSVPTPGSTVSLTIDTGKVFQYSSPVYCYAFNDPQNTWFAGFVTSYNTSSGAMNVVAQFISSSASAQTGFTCSLAPLAQNNASLNNWASDTLTIPSSVPSDLHFATVVASQYFPIQGQVLITCTTNTANQMTGQVKAYNGTDMYVTVTSVLAGGGTSCAAWSFYLPTGPTTRISLYQMNGLRIAPQNFAYGSFANIYTVTAGSVRDSTDTIDLAITSNYTLDLSNGGTGAVLVTKTGTIAIDASGNVTGTGTAFTTEFSTTASLTDWNNQLTTLGYSTVTYPALMSSPTWNPGGPRGAGAAVAIQTLTNNTTMTVNVAGASLGAGATINRGGYMNTNSAAPFATHAIVIAYNSTNGAVDIFGSSFTPSGNPDLPNNYTFYRVIGIITITSSSGPVVISQLLGTTIGSAGQALVSDGHTYQPSSLGPKAVYSATITPTALGINETSCNTTTGVVTFASDFSASLTASGQSVALTGTVSTGYTTGQAYYVHIVSNTTLTTWTAYADAVAGSGASQVKCTLNNNPGWSLRYLAYTNVFNIGFSTIAPVGLTPGSGNFALDLNLTNALAGTVGVVSMPNTANIVNTTPSTQPAWILRGTPTFSSTTLIQMGNGNFLAPTTGTLPGTITQQGTTAFTPYFIIWGALDDPVPANDNDLIERMVA